ncbi:LPS export ABC transporter periplasmic protein LptC [Marinobacter caseinilyticus]|uniref:LPS export ABC transporter periplasmic protein LptC n=1 Tax=Marinobacter caseinilyticus TaxID=2692195 RepID=UPI00140BEEDC|nr:LPS export ABC transporter periplasmic protein LptC [Marinobacter caseinilyticus]
MTLKNLLAHAWTRALALLLCAVVLVSMLWQSDEAREPTEARDLRGPSEPDGFVVNGRYLSFDEAGNRETLIESPRIEQFESRHLATMIAPKATLFDADSGTPWTLTANRGEFMETRDIIKLEGQVVITRPLSGGKMATLESEQLTLDNDNRTAYTDSLVTLTDSHGVTQAKGMKAWIDDRTLELKSQVEGRYETVKSSQQ